MSRSQELMREANKWIPGGVNSPARALLAVNTDPIFFQRGAGAYLWDEDNRRFIDYVCSWGAIILGHADPEILDAVASVLGDGFGFGAATAIEVEFAKLFCQLAPNIDMLRLVSTGTEATMSAIRLARGFTKRSKFIKFEGCYHGHSDALLVKAGSGALTYGHPSSAGVPAEFVSQTLVAQFNDLSSVEALFQQYPDSIAGIILEPIVGNMGCVPPNPGFLEGLRKICDHYQSLLIIDEVMTGFRVALGGAQALYQVRADIATYGKVIGAGLPVAGFGGRREIMELLSPLGPVYQAGTLSGNPIAVTAGLAALRHLQADVDFYARLAATTRELTQGIRALSTRYSIPTVVNDVPGMFTVFFTDQPQVTDYASVMRCDKARFTQFFQGLVQQGIYLAPSPYEACFLTAAHGRREIHATLEAIEHVFRNFKI